MSLATEEQRIDEQRIVTPPHAKAVTIIGPRDSILVWLRDMWAYRGVLVALCVRDVRSKYKQAALGVAWAVIQPVMQLAVFSLVVVGVGRVTAPVPYMLYALAALLPFNLFQQIVTMGTPSFVNSQGIVTKIYFPRVYTVISACSSAVVNALVASALLLIAFVAYGQRISPSALLAVPFLVATVLFGIGVASFLGAVNARFRDIQHGLPLCMMLFLYVSPVLYPVSYMPSRIRPLALANPVAGLVDGFRASLLGIDANSWPYSWAALAVSVVCFVAGLWYFERKQAELIDVL